MKKKRKLKPALWLWGKAFLLLALDLARAVGTISSSSKTTATWLEEVWRGREGSSTEQTVLRSFPMLPWREKHLQCKPDKLSLIPGTHIKVERENAYLKT